MGSRRRRPVLQDRQETGLYLECRRIALEVLALSREIQRRNFIPLAGRRNKAALQAVVRAPRPRDVRIAQSIRGQPVIAVAHTIGGGQRSRQPIFYLSDSCLQLGTFFLVGLIKLQGFSAIFSAGAEYLIRLSRSPCFRRG